VPISPGSEKTTDPSSGNNAFAKQVTLAIKPHDKAS